MAWRDQLRPASYRSAAFYVADSVHTGGKRAAVHVYPYRDQPYVEDLGRQPRRWKVTAYVIGPDYMRERDFLLEKLESRAPGYPYRPGGTLVHPFLGTLTVLPEAFEVEETKLRGGMATFTITFVEAGPVPEQPARLAGARAAIDESAAAVEQEAAAAAEDGLSVIGYVQGVRDAAANAMRKAGQAMARLDVFSGIASDVAAFQRNVTDLIDQASSLATAPADMAAQVLASVDAILSAAASFPDALEAYRALFGLSPDGLEGGASSQSVAADANAVLVTDLVRQAAVAGAARAAARISFATFEDAEAAREAITAELDLLLDTAPDAVYVELAELRSVLVSNVPPPSARLPRLRTVQLRAPLPSLVLAFQLYGDAGRADEIVARNRVVNPLYLPTTRPLEVLTS